MNRPNDAEPATAHYRVSQLATLINGFPFDSNDFRSAAEIPLVRIRDLNAPEFETFVQREKVPLAVVVRDGDVVIGMDGDFNSVLWDRGEAALNQRLCVLRARPGVDPRYLAYAIPEHLQAINDLTWSTTVKHLSAGSVRAIRIPAHSSARQRALADYLDRETAQIDAFIAKNEELIALLTERRTAVTAQAVTRGIDSSVPLRDSGMGWLGPIPADWQAIRVKFLVQSLPGYAFASGDFVDAHAATRLLRGINVGVGAISWSEVVGIENPTVEVESRYRLREGDLVLGMDRPVISGGLRVAAIGRGDEGALLVQRVLRLRGTRVRNDYLEYSLAWGGFSMYIEPDFTGVSVPHMSEQQVGNFAIALPNMAVQHQIVTHIREQHAAIDRALEAARRAIDLARERRAALISAAVTGKIDVGEAT